MCCYKLLLCVIRGAVGVAVSIPAHSGHLPSSMHLSLHRPHGKGPVLRGLKGCWTGVGYLGLQAELRICVTVCLTQAEDVPSGCLIVCIHTHNPASRMLNMVCDLCQNHLVWLVDFFLFGWVFLSILLSRTRPKLFSSAGSVQLICCSRSGWETCRAGAEEAERASDLSVLAGAACLGLHFPF